MSTFRVKLTQGDSRTGGGNLDENAQAHTYSIQRTMYAMGPNKINRKLNDGDTFVDCNYWKRFAYPQVPLNEAFIEVVTDDGAPYVDGMESIFLVTYSKSIAAGSSFSTSGNTVDVVGTYSAPAVWTTITSNALVQVRLNGDSSTDFEIEANTSQTFQRGDLLIDTIQFAKAASGTATVEVQVGVLSKCNS